MIKDKSMGRKLIFLDIDGTLLPPGDMLIPESTLAALDRARANGHKLFLCTGRNHRMTEPLLRHDCFAGAVCSAGGYVLCDGKTLVDIPMEPQQAEGVRATLERNGVECTLEARDATFGGSKMAERWSFIHKKNSAPLNSEAERWRKAMEEGMAILPLSDYKGEPLYKIVFIADHESDLAEAKQLYADQFVFCESKLDRLTDGFVNGELINRKFDKGTGIKAICDHLGCTLADTIGFGDSDNDLQMTDVVGISVCMANGSENLKKRCDRIAPSVYEDGIAKEFKALGLI
jgi:Cof subfamily protein (haloacid dehalogenase superfamily)